MLKYDAVLVDTYENGNGNDQDSSRDVEIEMPLRIIDICQELVCDEYIPKEKRH